MTAGGTMGTKWRRTYACTKTELNWSIMDLGSQSTATTGAVQKKFAVRSLVLHGQQWLRVRQETARKQFSSPDRGSTCWRRVVAGRFHFDGASRPQLRWSTTASWVDVGDSVIAARSTLSKTVTRALNMLKGTDRWTARGRDCIPQACLRIANQPPAAWPRRRIWALLSNIGMAVGTVALQALVIGR